MIGSRNRGAAELGWGAFIYLSDDLQISVTPGVRGGWHGGILLALSLTKVFNLLCPGFIFKIGITKLRHNVH